MIRVIEFDFDTREDRDITVDEVPSEPSASRYCWIDADAEDRDAADALLARCGVPEPVRSQVFGPDLEGRLVVYDGCLHASVSEVSEAEGRFAAVPVDIVLTEGFLFTYRTQDASFLQSMRLTCRSDFRRFSRSPGFLVYEIGDHLLGAYRKAVRRVSGAVEQVQIDLFGAVDDQIFRQVAALTSGILSCRKTILSARDLFHELASRRSPFVSETTQPFLDRIALTLARLGDDLTSEREVLSETLNLYLGIVSHRTNRIVNRLTVISMIFLPLSFLCGVYGMNFEEMPELGWSYGYLFFWGLALTVGVGLLTFVHRKRWI